MLFFQANVFIETKTDLNQFIKEVCTCISIHPFVAWVGVGMLAGRPLDHEFKKKLFLFS